MPRTRRVRALTAREILDFTRFFAGEVRSGKYPYVAYDAESRWHQRIYRDQRLDVWIISWLPSQGTQMHDHGGSSGSFSVLSGRLSEAVFGRSAGVTEFGRAAGSIVGFGPQYVHDVRNLGEEPAVSVHAYSPPLTAMNYYEVDDGALVRLATVATEDPEPDAQFGTVTSVAS
jgi:mannose-6-phosphate isomerase-like protein (cupin superfamily)